VHLLDPLVDARGKSLPWQDVATRLRRLEAGAPLAPDGQPWIRAVEAASGYSANHLRRMATALSAIEEMQQHWPDHTAVLGRLSFSHAEILGRLWEADRREVEQLLGSEQWPSYAQLLSKYEKSRTRRSAPGAAGKLAAGKFRRLVGLQLRQRYGSALLEPVPHHPYLKPDFLAALMPDMLVAWDCLLVPARIDEDALRRRFLSWATEASFVTVFWVVTQDDRAVEHVARCITELGLDNIGLAIAGDMSGLKAAIKPHGLPNPDRRRAAVNQSF